MLPFAAISQTATLSQSETKAVSLEVNTMLYEYLEAMNTGGLTTEFKYLDNSPQFFWVPPGYDSWISYDSVATVLKATAPTLKSIDYQYEYLRIEPLTTHFASYTGKITGTLVTMSGDTSYLTLLETGTVIKREDGWKLLNGQSALVPK
ncbi:MAG: nuclear transport factor 2 family protein [Cyclobacteriaceae bacterium]